MAKLLLSVYALFTFMFFNTARCSNLFEIEKEGESIHLYGTFHSLELEKLPEMIRNNILNHNVLITENTNHSTSLSREVCADMDVLHKGESYYEILNGDEKEELEKYILPFLQKKNAEIGIQDLNLKGLLQMYFAGHTIKGMDYTLTNFFKNKTIKGLETLNAVSQYFEEPTLDELQGTLAFKGGYDSEEAKLLEQAYLEGKLLQLPSGIEIFDRNKAWIEPIIHYHATYANEAIICVGVSHVLDLLITLAGKGFTIRRANNEGVFSIYSFEQFLSPSAEQSLSPSAEQSLSPSAEELL